MSDASDVTDVIADTMGQHSGERACACRGRLLLCSVPLLAHHLGQPLSWVS